MHIPFAAITARPALPARTPWALGVIAAGCLVMLAACGPGATAPVRFRAPPEVDSVDELRRAIGYVSYARVAARAGEYRESYAAYRAALRIHADGDWYADAAQVAEKGQLFGEAHDCWLQAAALAHDGEQRKAHGQQVDRLKSLIPAGLVPVAMVVEPQGVRVELRQEDKDDSRPILGDEVVWLEPGYWTAEDPDSVTPGAVARFRVGAAGPHVVAVAVQRRPGDEPPSRVAKADPNAKGPTKVDPKPNPEPDKTPDPNANPGKNVVPDPEVTPDPGPEQKATASSSIHRWAPWVVTGLGVAAVGAGVFFGTQAMANADVANGLNPASKSYDSNLALYGDAAKDNARYANVAIAAGGALVAGGVSWLVLRPHTRSTILVDAGAGAAAPGSAWTFGFFGKSVLARLTF